MQAAAPCALLRSHPGGLASSKHSFRTNGLPAFSIQSRQSKRCVVRPYAGRSDFLTETVTEPRVASPPEKAVSKSIAARDLNATLYVSDTPDRTQNGVIFSWIQLRDVNGNETRPFFLAFGKLSILPGQIGREYNVKVSVPKNFGEVGSVRVYSVKLQTLLSKLIDFPVYLEHFKFEDPNSPNSPVLVPCHSWVSAGQGERVFFSNKVCLPQYTPKGTVAEREKELQLLRGDLLADPNVQPSDIDRTYDYAIYNDLNRIDPVTNELTNRPVLGGAEWPYPRRLATKRPPIVGRPGEESEPPKFLGQAKAWLPRDEKFDKLKDKSFKAKSVLDILPKFILKPMDEFSQLSDVALLYKTSLERVRGIFAYWAPFGYLLSWLLAPLPGVITGRNCAWDQDEEFGRQVLAGMHPCAVTSINKLPEDSTITDDNVAIVLGGRTLKERLAEPGRMFLIDYVGIFLPYVARINSLGEERFQYATRCLLMLGDDGCLRPVAIELALRDDAGADTYEVFSVKDGPEVWRLAKAQFLVSDTGYHQLIAHWLRTHACVEPFIVSTVRNLSVMHPLYKLLRPHFKYTLNINSNARSTLISAGGFVEQMFNPGKYCMEMSSVVYGALWEFKKEALPADLIKRNMAVEATDGNGAFSWKGKKYNIVLGEDYPYASDGILIWNAIHKWVDGYLSLFYKSDADLKNDTELTGWWEEIQTKGHPDKAPETWPALKTKADLVDIASSIIYTSSAQHAAVNFGQFEYSGYMPNRPSIARKPMPDKSTYREVWSKPDRAYLDMVSNKDTSMLVASVMEVLSTHDAREEYIATRSDQNDWTSDPTIAQKLEEFQADILAASAQIDARNADPGLRHRKVDYDLQQPYLTGPAAGIPVPRGVPNSVSI